MKDCRSLQITKLSQCCEWWGGISERAAEDTLPTTPPTRTATEASAGQVRVDGQLEFL